MLLKQVNQDGRHDDMFFNFDFHGDNLLNVGVWDLQFGVTKMHKGVMMRATNEMQQLFRLLIF